jgi:hypothetical protein
VNNVGASVDGFGGAHGIWMEADHEDGVSASSDKTLIWSTTSNIVCRIVNDSRVHFAQNEGEKKM